MKYSNGALDCREALYTTTNIHSQSSSHAQVASDNPFLSLGNFPPFVQKTILPVLMQKSHSNLQLDSDGLSAFITFTRELLGGAEFGVKDGFAPNNTCCWSSKINE